MRRSLLVFCAALAPCVAHSGDRVIQIILADGRTRPAFYEVAPTYLATSMLAAVRRECAAQKQDKPSVPAWLCSGEPIYFLRGVQDDGAEDDDGVACDGEPRSKYYAADIVQDDLGCVAVYYDSEQKVHSLE